MTGCWSLTNRVLNTKHWGVTLTSFKRVHPGIWVPQSSILQSQIAFPFHSKTPSGSVNPNIKMAYEYTCSLTGIVLFSRIPLGVQKTLLHGGGVTSCGTYSHQSGPQAIPPTVSSADPACRGSRWVRSRWLFSLDAKRFICFLHISSESYL